MPASVPATLAPHRLRAGAFETLVTPTGGGHATFGALALTRHTPDPTTGGDGPVVYVRDLDRGTVWSVGYAPAGRTADRYEVQRQGDVVGIRRVDGDIETRMEIAVTDGAEIRRITLTNHGAETRRLDVTTYLEVVLNSAAGDHGHPAFSKLFVQTDRIAELDALVAERRLRSPHDTPLAIVHTLVPDDGPDGPAAFETDRMRFVGRGRTLAAPAALDLGAALSGTTGAVLDPILSLRRAVTLGPGQTTALTYTLGAGDSRRAALDAVYPHLSGARSRALLAAARDASDESAPLASLPTAKTPPVRPAADVWPADTRTHAEAFPDLGPLRVDNTYGGFSADGRAYVIRVVPGQLLPPLPWSNVLTGPEVGGLVSERAIGTSWGANSRENRLTPWSNDPVVDAPSEGLWLRDDDAGAFWNLLPGTHAQPTPHTVTHAFGHTTWEAAFGGLRQRVQRFAAVDAPAMLTRVEVTNEGDGPWRLTLVTYARLVLGGLAHETHAALRTWADGGVLYATNPDRADEYRERTAFARLLADGDETHRTTDRTAFVGACCDEAMPCGVVDGRPLDGTTEGADDPCVAHAVTFTLAPGQTWRADLVFGEASNADAARAAAATFDGPGAIDAAFEATVAFWNDVTGAVTVTSPSEPLDLMLSGWLAYQNLACRMMARTAFYQSGGAYGFRDQLQDASMFALTHPDVLRRQILLHAAHQFPEGDVLHWWHTPASKGIRTRFADDLLWLPYLTDHYLRSTGDDAVLDEVVGFVQAPPLQEGDDEVFVHTTPSSESASVYEHIVRVLDRSLTRGAHGLPLMGVGDWNDGMNRVGREGRGESVWMGFFLYRILGDWIPRVEARGDADRADRYRAYRDALHTALNADGGGWDGAWYRRAYYDDGTPLGSHLSDECRIDALAQAWAVLSGAAPPERATQALDAMEEHLVDRDAGIVRLLTPAFDRTPHDPGYIKGYLPGVRENGGQYTHAALWAVRALAQAGRCDRAAGLLEMLTPVAHTATKAQADVYMAEPYVVAADVYGVEPHVGRGGWTWYTGSAGWMQRVGVESILGLTAENGALAPLRPCLPPEWAEARVTVRLPGGETVTRTVTPSGSAPTA